MNSERHATSIAGPGSGNPLLAADLEGIETALAERHLSDYIAQAWRRIETVPYVPNWHIDAIAEHLEAVSRGELDGILVINIPFRCMKSRIVSVFWPTWTWAQNPDPRGQGHGYPVRPGTWLGPGTKFLTTAYASNIAIRDATTSRRLLDSDWYQRRWGERVTFTADQNQKQRYENRAGGLRIAASRGAVLGEGGDIVIVDDPISREEAHSDAVRVQANQWWDETISSRVNDPERSVFVVIMQRLHQKDTTGHILEKESNVTHLMLPMEFEPERRCYSPVKTSISGPPVQARYLRSRQCWIPENQAPVPRDEAEWNAAPDETVHPLDPRQWPEELLWESRFSRSRVDALKTTLTSYGAAGQLQQRPSPKGGGLFKRGWFEIVDALPPKRRRCRGWDLAATEERRGKDPDWTAGVLMSVADGIYYVEDVVRFRKSPGEVERALKSTASLDAHITRIRLPQDPGQAGKSQASRLVRLLAGYTVRVVPPGGSKATRAGGLIAQAEHGNVRILKASWNEAFLDELCMFPFGAHDDQVDAAADAFNELTSGPTYSIRKF